jgi:hypothetical protein
MLTVAGISTDAAMEGIVQPVHVVEDEARPLVDGHGAGGAGVRG